jgi:hypothetical protein
MEKVIDHLPTKGQFARSAKELLFDCLLKIFCHHERIKPPFKDTTFLSPPPPLEFEV